MGDTTRGVLVIVTCLAVFIVAIAYISRFPPMRELPQSLPLRLTALAIALLALAGIVMTAFSK